MTDGQLAEIEERASGRDPHAYHDVRRCQRDRDVLLAEVRRLRTLIEGVTDERSDAASPNHRGA